MSAISTQSPPKNDETNSLIQAAGVNCDDVSGIGDGEYAEVHAAYSPSMMAPMPTQLGYLQRASARMILDALDQHFPPSAERSKVRERVLDTLAYYAKEVERWASSLERASFAEVETSETPSST